MGGRGGTGSRGTSGTKEPEKQLTKTEKMVNKIADKIIIEDWIEGSYMDEDEIESIYDYHDLLEHLDMDSREARDMIMESLNDDAWNYVMNRRNASEDDKELTFDDDGSFDTGDGGYMKYGEVMKLVKQRLHSKGYLQKPK